jgi:hypothetical protein
MSQLRTVLEDLYVYQLPSFEALLICRAVWKTKRRHFHL